MSRSKFDLWSDFHACYSSSFSCVKMPCMHDYIFICLWAESETWKRLMIKDFSLYSVCLFKHILKSLQEAFSSLFTNTRSKLEAEEETLLQSMEGKKGNYFTMLMMIMTIKLESIYLNFKNSFLSLCTLLVAWLLSFFHDTLSLWGKYEELLYIGYV